MVVGILGTRCDAMMVPGARKQRKKERQMWGPFHFPVAPYHHALFVVRR